MRKLGVPGREELAMGAIATGGVRVLNQGNSRGFHVPDHLMSASREMKNLNSTGAKGTVANGRPWRWPVARLS